VLRMASGHGFAKPGEYYHSFRGEYGGLWRRLGCASNVIASVGFIAQGFDFPSYYCRTPDSHNLRSAFIFEGGEDEIIGDFGLVGGGALFATSPIAWCGSLSHNHHNNNVSRITKNVLRRLVNPSPFSTAILAQGERSA